MNNKTLIILFLPVLISCKNEVQEIENRAKKEESIQKALVDVNQYMTRRNMKHIQNFVRRSEWPMKRTQTGLWYWVYDSVGAQGVEENDIVSYSYTRRLINGALLDSIPKEKPVAVQLGQGGIERGIEEGLLKMTIGSKAKFILPPHLAFGNFGDMENVPPGAILIYDVYLQNKK